MTKTGVTKAGTVLSLLELISDFSVKLVKHYGTHCTHYKASHQPKTISGRKNKNFFRNLQIFE